jgi:molecular chaperone GrpE
MNNEKEKELENIDDEARLDKVAELDILKQSLEETKTKTAEYYDKFLRLSAEFSNYKNRVDRERKELICYSHKEILKELLPFLDSFDKALEAEHKNIEELISGMKIVQNVLWDTLKKQGLKKMEVIGEKFDPNFHEAIGFDESDKEENIVTFEIHAGYLLNEKVLRPAIVRISKKILSTKS